MKATAVALMSEYQWRINGSVTRVYESLVAWDFAGTDPEWGPAQAKFLAGDLEELASESVRVSLRKMRVEVSLRAMNKGRFVSEILSALPQPPDFILIGGDDVTDEDMYGAAEAWAEAAPPSQMQVFTLSVGRSDKRTRARHCLPDVAAMQELVIALSEVEKAAIS